MGRGPHAPQDALQLLAARDNVAYAFEHLETPTAAAIAQATALDTRLRAVLPHVHAAAAAEVPDWRDARLPPPTAWWWPPTPAGETTVDLLWTIITTLVIAAAVALTADMARRFLAPGVDFLGVFVTLILIVLVLFAANALTVRGRRLIGRVADTFGLDSEIADDFFKLFQRGIDRVFPRLGVRRGREQWARLALAVTALLVLFALSRLLPPLVARYYNNRGIAAFEAGRLAQAAVTFERALAIDPDQSVVHYNLGNVYEEGLDYDAAIREYTLGLSQQHADGRYFFLYNNLARLYLLHKQEPGSAVKLLDTALESKSIDALTRYGLLKNRGWAYLSLMLPRLAERDLRAAMDLKPDGGAAHCLLAQVQEMLGQAAQASWEQCVAYARDFDVEPGWAALAQERLAGGSAK